MTQTPPPSGPPGLPALVSFVYWRKNPFLAASMMPLVITLADGRFTAIGPDGQTVFDAPANTIAGSLGKMGTLKITVNGKKFAIVGRPSMGGTEKGFTPGQQGHAQQFLQRYPQASAVQRVPAGIIDASFNGAAAAKLGVWRDGLNACGAAIS